MKFCEECGVQLSENAKFCSSCGNPCEIIEAVEKGEFCESCGSKLEDDDLFCPECGEPCCTLEEYENRQGNHVKGAESGISIPSDSDNRESSSSINYLCLVFLIGCIILWYTAPFAAINLATLGDQPTALQLVMDDVIYIGELTESTAFWAAIASIIGIIICFISTVVTANGMTRIVAVLTEIPLTIALFDIVYWADDIEEFLEAIGPGFWGIFILLFIVICASGKNESPKNGDKYFLEK